MLASRRPLPLLRLLLDPASAVQAADHGASSLRETLHFGQLPLQRQVITFGDVRLPLKVSGIPPRHRRISEVVEDELLA